MVEHLESKVIYTYPECVKQLYKDRAIILIKPVKGLKYDYYEYARTNLLTTYYSEIFGF